MAQRISRAKQRIKSAGLRFDLPPEAERAERLRVVLHVLYLVFNEGYAASSGPALQRADLTAEAIRLTRLLHRAAARRRRGRRPARPDAAHRRAAGRPDRRRRLAGAARRAGPLAVEPPRRSTRASRWSPAPSGRRRSARTSCRPRSPPCTTRQPARSRPTGRRSSPCTRCSSGSRPARWSRSTARSPSRWCTAPGPASPCSAPWTTTTGWPTPTGSRRSADTCSSGPAT